MCWRRMLNLMPNFTSKIISPSAIGKNQKKYVVTIQKKDVVFCRGPAGTGKTHLAMGMAAYYYRKDHVNKIVVTRPAVEAGESIGYTPGDIHAKMDPFLRPVFDELQGFMTESEVTAMINEDHLQVVPIAYMRGRTFKNAFIVADECQNLSKDQLKMLYTRMGKDSKLVLTGDTTQSDLDRRDQGAFAWACDLFEDMDEVGVVTLQHSDIQRHETVSKMLKIWENAVDKPLKGYTME